MKNTILAFCCILLQQPLFAENKDWLIDGSPYKTEVNLSSDKKQIELTNGLLRRSFFVYFRLSSNSLPCMTM